MIVRKVDDHVYPSPENERDKAMAKDPPADLEEDGGGIRFPGSIPRS
jgi:hypothetical protein